MERDVDYDRGRASDDGSPSAEAGRVRSISAQVGMLRVTCVIPVAQAVPPEAEAQGKGMPWLGVLLCLALLVGCGRGAGSQRSHIAESACSRKALESLGESIGRTMAHRAEWSRQFPTLDPREAAIEADLRAKVVQIQAQGCGL